MSELRRGLTLLGLLFIGLRLTDHITWSWWLVTLPFYRVETSTLPPHVRVVMHPGLTDPDAWYTVDMPRGATDADVIAAVERLLK